jgi:hypothetical protein
MLFGVAGLASRHDVVQAVSASLAERNDVILGHPSGKTTVDAFSSEDVTNQLPLGDGERTDDSSFSRSSSLFQRLLRQRVALARGAKILPSPGIRGVALSLMGASTFFLLLGHEGPALAFLLPVLFRMSSPVLLDAITDDSRSFLRILFSPVGSSLLDRLRVFSIPLCVIALGAKAVDASSRQIAALITGRWDSWFGISHKLIIVERV